MRAGRAAASIVLAGALLLGTTACTFLTPQATLFHYDAGNGVGVTVGDIDVRDAVALINDEGDAISLLITLVNRSNERVDDIVLQYQSGGEKTEPAEAISVDGRGVTQFGTTQQQSQIIILDPDVAAGGLLPVYVQYGDESGKTILVPVLNGTLPEYAELLPVKPTPTPTPTVEPTPAATEAPAEG